VNILDCAYSYIESSPQWPLFVVCTKTKRPVFKTGTDHAEHASTDPATIERWFTREYRGDRYGLGMPTGSASGTVVIDADAKHDGETKLGGLEAALGSLPRTRVVRSQSGGLHIYCAHPGNGLRVRTGQGERSPLGYLIGNGVDVRADGGIIVLPPTNGYRWIADDDTLPPLPLAWLLAIQGAGEAPRENNRFRSGSAPRGEQPERKWTEPERGDVIHSGDRNGALYRRGVALRHAGATDLEITDDLHRANAARCNPPLPAREVDKIAASAARATGRAA
jgi:hypothetical protein